MGDKGRQDPRESELTMQHRETRKGVQWETEGDKTRGKADTPSNKGKQKGVQWETKKTSDPLQGGRTIHQKETRKKGVQWETKGDKTLAKADTPSNKGKEEKGVQWETNKGRRTHHPAKGNKKRGTMGDKGRQDPREGGHTIQQREAPFCKGKQEGVQWERKGDKTLGKADTPSNTKAGALRKH